MACLRAHTCMALLWARTLDSKIRARFPGPQPTGPLKCMVSLILKTWGPEMLTRPNPFSCVEASQVWGLGGPAAQSFFQTVFVRTAWTETGCPDAQ